MWSISCLTEHWISCRLGYVKLVKFLFQALLSVMSSFCQVFVKFLSSVMCSFVKFVSSFCQVLCVMSNQVSCQESLHLVALLSGTAVLCTAGSGR